MKLRGRLIAPNPRLIIVHRDYWSNRPLTPLVSATDSSNNGKNFIHVRNLCTRRALICYVLSNAGRIALLDI